jgi:hypothetical protein
VEPAFVANISRRRTVAMILGATLFVIAGIVIVHDPRGDVRIRLAGCAAILFFGLIALVRAGQLIRGGPDIRIDEQGIWWRRWSDQVVPWDAVATFHVTGEGRMPFLHLVLVDPAAHPSTRPMAKLARLTRAWRRGDISVTTNATDRSFAELLAAVERFAPRVLLDPPPGRPDL